MTTRQDKINSLVQREIGKFIQQEQYEGISGMVTITDVEVTADLSEAKVYVSMIGQDADEVLKVLNQNIYEIQGYLNKRLVLRKVPRIKFLPDQSGEQAAHISELMKKIKDG